MHAIQEYVSIRFRPQRKRVLDVAWRYPLGTVHLPGVYSRLTRRHVVDQSELLPWHQFAVFREALHLLDEGVVSAEDLDRAMTGGPGFRWSFLGPLRAADFGGLDVFHSICSYLWPDLSDATSPPPVLNEKLQAGHLGTKAGAGFYRYPPDELADLTDRRDRFLLNLKQLVEDMKTNKEKPSPAKTQATSSSNLDNAKR